MRKIATALFAGVSVACLASPALAQANDRVAAGTQPPTSEPEGADIADNSGELAATNDIVVTARRREESVQDVPQTVNVVTAAQVEKLNLRTFQEIATIVPGLTLTQTSPFSSQATVRGIAFVPEASGSNPSVEFYLNDAPISSNMVFQSTYDFGQFELQRGPQGTLRGRASPSGSIAVTTRRPDLSEVGMVMNGTITNTDAYKLDGAFNIPIIADVLGVRVAGVVDETRGTRVRSLKELSDSANNERPFRRTKSIRGSVRFEPADWAAFNFVYQSLHAEDHFYNQVASNSLFVTGAPATTPIIRPFDRLSIDDQGNYGRQDQDIYVGNVDLSFAGQRLSYVGAYTKQDFGSLAPQDQGDFFTPPRVNLRPRVFADLAGFEAVCQNEARLNSIRPTTGAFFTCTHGTSRNESHELRLASDERIADIFDYVVGGFYYKTGPRSRLTQETPIVSLATGNISTVALTSILRDADAKEKSVFGNLTAHLGDIEISGGVRYIDFENFSGLAIGSRPNTPATTLTADTVSANATIYLASIKYQITPDFMVYAQTGSSWRPGPRAVGNFSLRLTPRELSFINLPAERSKSYEIGAKTSFLDGRGRFNISGYYQDLNNYPFRGPSVPFVNFTSVGGVVTPAVGTFNFLAAVPVEVKGVEAEASFQILDRWSLGANASYSDGRIKNGTIACLDLDRNGIPDTNVAVPTLQQLQAALPPGENIAQCSGLNRRSLEAPKFSANLQSEFGFALGAAMDGFLRGSATIFGTTNNDPDNTFDDVSAYGLLNLFAGLRDPDGGWEITLFGKNILREREILAVGSGPLATTFRAPAATTFTSEYRSVTVTQPREFGISARFAIGSR